MANELLRVSSLDGYPLSRCASLVLVACNLELTCHLTYPLGNVVHCLHRVDVGLVEGKLQVLWLIGVLWPPVLHLHLLARRVRQRRLEEELDPTALTLNNRVSLVQLDTLLEEGVDLSPPLFYGKLFV